MSDIDAPSKVNLQTGKGATRVTRPSPTSDENSARQQPTDKKSPSPNKVQETKEAAVPYGSAVTISTNLSSLEAGSKIIASYLGVDGQDRPLITSETGTYVVKYDASYQAVFDKIPQKAVLDVKILKIDREIEARIIFTDPAARKSGTPPLSLPVVLELTGLGNAPPTVKLPLSTGNIPLEQQKNSYQETGLYRAERIALESAHKLKDLPLPTTTTNYILYEKAVPNHNGPAIIRTSVPGNALIAQEIFIKNNPSALPAGQSNTGLASSSAAAANAPTSAVTLETNTIAEQTRIKATLLTQNVGSLLQKNIFATVIKNIPHEGVNLPKIVQKHLGPSGPLTSLKAGHNFTLRVESLAIPDSHHGVTPAEHAPKAARDTAQTPVPAPQNRPQNKPGNPLYSTRVAPQLTNLEPKMAAPQESRHTPQGAKAAQNSLGAAPPAQPEFSGIIIAPGNTILQDSTAPKPEFTRQSNRYPNHYTPSQNALQPTGSKNEFTLYLATPVSVIKFQSPVELKAGTVMSFSLPNHDARQSAATWDSTSAPQTGRQEPPASAQKSDITMVAKTTLPKEIKRPDINPKNSPKVMAAETTVDKNIPPKSQNIPTQISSVPSWVALSLTDQPSLAQPAEMTLLPQQPLENFIHNWQSLSQILSVMPPPVGVPLSHSLNNRLPSLQNPAHMTSTMVFFLAAMGARNPAQTWLGPDITQQMRQAGHEKLLHMLDNDMQRIFRLGADTPHNEWRPVLIPLHGGADVSALPMLIRQMNDEPRNQNNAANKEDDNDDKAAVRFIVELGLSQLGQMQVDGLLKEKKLDIILRSKMLLPPEMKNKMSHMFTTSLDIRGYTGDLQFKDNRLPDFSVQNVINQKIHMHRPQK